MRRHGHLHCRMSWAADPTGQSGWSWVDKGGLTGKEYIPAGPVKDQRQNPQPSALLFATQPRRIRRLARTTAMSALPPTSFLVHGPDGNARLYCELRPSPVCLRARSRHLFSNRPHIWAGTARTAAPGMNRSQWRHCAPKGFTGLSGSGSQTIKLNASGTKLSVSADMLSATGSLTLAHTAAGQLWRGGALAPVRANVTDTVVMSGLKLGQEITLTLTLKDAVLFTLSFTN